MLQLKRIVLLTAIGVAMSKTTARASPHFEAMPVGTPTNGSVVMTGYTGYVIRAVSDLGPISDVDLGYLGFISGGLAQRWTDPTASSHYTVTSPGPNPARNTSPSDFNFDTHFILDPTHITVETVHVPGVPGATSPQPYEGTTISGGFITHDDDPQFMPILSTPSVGYGVASSPQDIFAVSEDSMLRGRFGILPAYRNSVIDVAYVVSNSSFKLDGGISLDEGATFHSDGFAVLVPEPVGLPCLLILISYLISRKGGAGAGRNRLGLSDRHSHPRQCPSDELRARYGF